MKGLPPQVTGLQLKGRSSATPLTRLWGAAAPSFPLLSPSTSLPPIAFFIIFVSLGIFTALPVSYADGHTFSRKFDR